MLRSHCSLKLSEFLQSVQATFVWTGFRTESKVNTPVWYQSPVSNKNHTDSCIGPCAFFAWTFTLWLRIATQLKPARNKLGTGPFSKESEIGHIGALAARWLKCTCSRSWRKFYKQSCRGVHQLEKVKRTLVLMGYYDNLWYDYTLLQYQVVRRMLSIGPYQSCSFEKQFVWICVISRYCFKDFDLQTAEYTRALENFWCPPCRIRHGFGRDRNTFLAFRLQMASCCAFGQALGSIQCHCGGVRLVECCWCVFEVGIWLISVDVKTYYDTVLGCFFSCLAVGNNFTYIIVDVAIGWFSCLRHLETSYVHAADRLLQPRLARTQALPTRWKIPLAYCQSWSGRELI